MTAVTRLSLTGTPAAAYSRPFKHKGAHAVSRLGQFGIGAARYPGFQPKSVAIIVPPEAVLSEPYAAIAAAFLNRLAEAWTQTVVIGLNGITAPPADGAAFVVVEFDLGKELKPSVVSRRFVLDGRAELALCIPTGTGLAAWLAMADDLAHLFREVEFGGLRTYTPSPPLIGDFDDSGSWLRLRILVPYRRVFEA